MRFRKFAIAALIAAPALTACTVANPAPDQNGILYDKGIVSDTEFNRCIAPGEKSFSSAFDQAFEYPAGQRSYVFSAEEGGRDRAPYSAPTKDAVTIGVEGQMRFELTSDCELLRQFHEKIGLRYQNEDGWLTILRTYLDQPLNRAVAEVTQGMDWKALYSDPAAKAKWEKDIAEKLPTYINQAAGGAYFVNVGVTLQKPVLPSDLTDALQAAQTAQQQKSAQESRNDQIDVELEAIRKLVEVLGADGYVAYKAVQEGDVQVLPIPQGTGVVVGK